MVEGLDDDVVGEDVELLLDFPLNVLRLGRPDDVRQAGAPDLRGDHFRREREIVQNARELTRGVWVKALLLDDESLDRDDRGRGVSDHVFYVRGRRGGNV